ncbi:MAG: class I SAM-dependent methyltransferase [Gaiellaceae bacterium]
MAEAARDMWARWVLEKRDSGGDPELVEAGLEWLRAVRDRVLANADVTEGDVLLDVGTGDGLIGFGAHPLVGESGRVFFSDVSEQLVEHCRGLAANSNVGDRCQFIVASADNLSNVPDGAVDVVTTRSVLIYVKDKARAFREFFRVLRPGGRLSIFEPINRFGYPEPEDRFIGYDVAPVVDLARKVWAVYHRLQPPEDPMLDFDERDLLAFVAAAGFSEIRLDLEVRIERSPWSAGRSWDAFLRTSGNPRLPPIAEVLDEALNAEERKRFSAHLRPLVEQSQGTSRLAVCYLWAVKHA